MPKSKNRVETLPGTWKVGPRFDTGRFEVSEAVSAEPLWRQAQDFIRKLEGR